MKRELRTHQQRAIEMLRASLAAGRKRPVLAAPTGFGKTMLAASIVESALSKGKRVIFTVPALSLVDQTVQMFYDEGLHDVGVIQAHHCMTNWSKPVQVASVQTLQRRDVPDADFVVIDECHKLFSFYTKWMTMESWRNRPFIGLSATPWTRGLGRLFDDLIIATTTEELIGAGFLAQFRVFAPSHPDLSQVRTVAGDYHEGDLSDVMSDSPLIADVTDTWVRRAENRSTLCFAVDRAHAKHLQEKFLAAGVAAEYVDAYTPVHEREAIRERFHDGRARVVCNVGCLTTGVDWDVRCIILARPTKSEMLYVQMIGRGLRTAEGKEDCLILDHSDTTLRLGFVTDIHHDVLDDGRERGAKKATGVRLPKECPKCAFLKPPSSRQCPACGFVAEVASQVEQKDGELVEVTGRKKGDSAPIEDRRGFFGQLKGYAEQRGYQSGWAAHKYREKFGAWPNGMKDVPTVQPQPQVLSWIKSRQIAWARSKSNPNAQQASA